MTAGSSKSADSRLVHGVKANLEARAERLARASGDVPPDVVPAAPHEDAGHADRPRGARLLHTARLDVGGAVSVLSRRPARASSAASRCRAGALAHQSWMKSCCL